jgi:ribosome-binding protein aMBF1 (putative translation factor)
MALIDLRVLPLLESTHIDQLILHAGGCPDCPAVSIGDLGPDRRPKSERRGDPETERNMAITIAEMVRELRGEKGMTQDQVAALIGTKQPAIARVESGRSLPSPDLLVRIAGALGVRLVIRFEKPGDPE